MIQPFKRPKILVVTCMHNRPKVSEIFIHNICKIKELYKMDYNIDIFSGCSSDEDLALCLKNGIFGLILPNNPISDKWNHILHYAISFDNDYDYVYFTGDDDLVDPNIFNLYNSKIEAKVDVFGLNSIFFLSPEKKEAMNFTYHHKNKILGGGKMVSRKAIDTVGNNQRIKVMKDFTHNGTLYKRHQEMIVPVSKADYLSGIGFARMIGGVFFEFWPSGINSGLDTHSDIKLLLNGFHPVGISTLIPYMIDIKTDVNIWKFDDYRKVSKPYNYDHCMNAFLDDKEKELINKL